MDGTCRYESSGEARYKQSQQSHQCYANSKSTAFFVSGVFVILALATGVGFFTEGMPRVLIGVAMALVAGIIVVNSLMTMHKKSHASREVEPDEVLDLSAWWDQELALVPPRMNRMQTISHVLEEETLDHEMMEGNRIFIIQMENALMNSIRSKSLEAITELDHNLSVVEDEIHRFHR